MKCYITLAALAAIAPVVLATTINTPSSVVECQPQLLSWNGGQAPYYLSIIPGGQPSAAPLKTFPTTSDSSVTWIVDIPGGTLVTFALKDSTGATSYTDTVNIQKGPDSRQVFCTGGGGGAAPAPAPAPAPAQDPAVTTPQAADTTDNSSAAVSDNSGAGSTAAPASSGAASGTAASTRAATAPAGATTSAARAGTTVVAAASTARGSASVVAAASASASRAATGATSGAGARYSVTGLGVAGIFGLVGAMFL
ncbi:hypothetical protein D9619_004809 [Psilocybe cf. subviscida]|uniref:Uncharacterized protein n=1 Tax=Psilocybe cf. subviscida TaxID=2480587 RepID=A0A8H5BR89_9AGAR|nr:hypothetical protein D9619_004809 [Psilocybe cf. subviscida]